MASNLKWTLLFDASKCNGCQNCTLATRDEHVGNAFTGYSEEMPLHGHRWIDLRCHERGQSTMVDITYCPVMCQHCEDMPCAKAAPDGAVTRRPDGIVIIDPIKSKGARQIVEDCPIGAVWWNEEKNIPQHWNFDAHLLDEGWQQPRCSHACPTGALSASKISDDEYQALVETGGVKKLGSAKNPRVLYKGIEPLTTYFVGGTIVRRNNEDFDCVPGVRVTLQDHGHVIGEAISDLFGDFKIDHIARTSQQEVTLCLNGIASLPVQLTQSLYLGRVIMDAFSMP